MSELGACLRSTRLSVGVSLGRLAVLIHYSKGYLSLVERGGRPATTAVVAAYERVLGVDGLGHAIHVGEFQSVAGLVEANTRLVRELVACIAGGDASPLAVTQTSYAVDLGIASLVDRGAVKVLRRWACDAQDPIARVNATGILAKIPGQRESDEVARILANDAEVRDRYLTAVVARVCGLEWAVAAAGVTDPRSLVQPTFAADRFCREAVNPADGGARWCAAEMLQRLSPLIGR